jgi:Tfp pilus assembly pilus retraction ATPase PilT
MREPFAYENNVVLIRQLIVPDPVSPEKWLVALAGWEDNGAGFSLLEWLVVGGLLEEGQLLGFLGGALGVRTRGRGSFRLVESGLPEAGLLRAQGFVELEPEAGRRLYAGGPQLPPDSAASNSMGIRSWEWVLVSPLRGDESADGHAGESSSESQTSHETRLREMLLGLWSEGASDIHFERVEGELAVRVHRNGKMHPVVRWRGSQVESSLRLLKTWSGLSTAAAPMPQDGRLQLSAGTREVGFRVAQISTINGESLVLRIPGGGSEIRPLEQLGVPDALAGVMLDTARNDPGLVVLAGATCSGKTTTAYALLQRLAERNLKMLTIEDPVEFELEAAMQSAVDERNGWTFDRAIRAYLRQDPDVIFIGEMRDPESAAAGCRAALTGHCVISTLHASSVDAAMERLAGWGITPGILAESLRLVVHQKLLPGDAGLRASFNWNRLGSTG